MKEGDGEKGRKGMAEDRKEMVEMVGGEGGRRSDCQGR